ncbi:MAG: tRNA (adenosine(37)-N6)-threonylcarbamoyltransferase complex ATPase subunit type 1 TsaE, partial [Anaerolineae bacterium]
LSYERPFGSNRMSPVLKPGTLDFISHSEAQTRRLGAKLGALAQPGHIIALLGNLGTGKTRLAQGFGSGLGVPDDEVINSPTFTFINQYRGRLTLYHIDLYRLNSPLEAQTLGLDDYLFGNGVCLIEWADRLGDALPAERLEVELYYLHETKRRVVMRARGPEHSNLLKTFAGAAFYA